ncbi:efflux RND transporter periplasmic adaptor subunit [Fulvivirgaceae bacterium PWU5]|uniref:Efflux RND transporter periplasmic adaptor subunit n=1 Tax=Dawidia cretensis TaxID=2782350 RepID=A0AAP2E1M1_9BACT|nr:efflux RND transporter periplasmic adaptor subunit [Dawidia cretensis]MBT1709982.1 efflux RND transporter periplasmic adaptor subunit [Dawidia cretensis]
MLVDTAVLRKGTFQAQLVSNGSLTASQKSDLNFHMGGYVTQILVQNGAFVTVGQRLALLDDFSYRQEVMRAETNLKKATVELKDLLIGYAGNAYDSSAIPPNIHEAARIRSGYDDALRDLKTARVNLAGTVVTAPFNGRVANVAFTRFTTVPAGAQFCTLIDDGEFFVEFYLMESEIGTIRLGDRIRVAPLSVDTEYTGNIREINPVVNEDGLILVKGSIKNKGHLLDGMHVKVFVEKSILGQWVVPKSAIVLRQNQEVLFRYVNGRALWTYVRIMSENNASYAIIPDPDKGGTIVEGDIIITAGNINLSHESSVDAR